MDIISYTKAKRAQQKADDVQTQLDQVVIDGDSSVEAAQARVDRKGRTHDTLKENLDVNFSEVDAQLAQIATYAKNFGAKGDGVTDDTKSINDAIQFCKEKGGGTVLLGDGVYLVDGANGDFEYRGRNGAIIMESGVYLELSDNAVIKQTPTNYDSYVIVNFRNVVNSGIKGGKIVGDRYTHSGSTGEWGYGVGVFSSQYVTIEDITIEECWGDGLNLKKAHDDILGSVSGKDAQNQNITIKNVTSTDNRRQGLSIESGLNIKVFDSEFNETNGTDPQCGIDIEPAGSSEWVDGVLISRCKIKDNQGAGILLYGGYGEVKNISVVECDLIDNLSIEGNFVTNQVSHTVLRNSKLINGSIRMQRTHQTTISNIQTTDGIGLHGCEDITIDNSTFKRNVDSIPLATISDVNGDQCRNIVFNNVTITTTPYTSSDIFERLRGYNINFVNCEISNGRSIGSIIDDHTITFKNCLIQNMSIEAIVLRNSSKGVFKNNIFTGICFDNSGAYMVRLNDSSQAVFANNDFYQENFIDDNLGTSKPSGTIIIQADTIIKGHSNYTDGLLEGLSSGDSSGYFPMTS